MIPFKHLVGEIIQKLLIDNGLGSDPDLVPLGAWPIYSPTEPALPDDCITTRTTTGRSQGRTMVDGETLWHYGFQIRFRATNDRVGNLKAEEVRYRMQTGMYQTHVTIDSSVYLIPCISNIGDVLILGIDNPNTKRSLFSLNALSAIRTIS